MPVPDLEENIKGNNDKKIDIRGKVCPMTFVYTKLTLEELNIGDTLEVILDYPPAVENIPESCNRQNLATLIDLKELDPKGKAWIMKLKRI